MAPAFTIGDMTGAVLWDLDGTLVDSEEYHWQSWRDTMQAEGVDITPEQFAAIFGQKNDRILQALLGDDLVPDRVRRLGDAKEAEFRRIAVKGGVVPLPGGAEWVARLHADGWRQAIATSAPRQNAEVILRALGLERFFDAVAAAEDVTAGKPDPQIFLAAAARLQMPAFRCIVVEDVAAGLQAARRAGMRCIGVSRTAALEADLVVRSLTELPPDAFTRLLSP